MEASPLVTVAVACGNPITADDVEVTKKLSQQ